jgi:hypothetical protein
LNAWTRRCYENHQEHAREKRRKYWALERRLARRRETLEDKNLVIEHYSNGTKACANPYGEHQSAYTNVLALSVDHIEGGGSKHRRELRYWSIYKWLVVEGFPSGYQILGMNCQMIKKTVENEYRSELLKHEGASGLGSRGRLPSQMLG